MKTKRQLELLAEKVRIVSQSIGGTATGLNLTHWLYHDIIPQTDGLERPEYMQKRFPDTLARLRKDRKNCLKACNAFIKRHA